MSELPKADFRFKQFSIWHDQCAMKVNTDGILLGAWTELTNASRILDIGTGTGLIALMLAQRSQQQALIAAIEVEPNAAAQATENVTRSPWPNKIDVVKQDVLDWQPSLNRQFDLIVSNPPYFTDALPSMQEDRFLARHNDGLSFQALLTRAYELSSEQANFCLVLPIDEAQRLLAFSAKIGWHLAKQCTVYNKEGGKAIRQLLQLGKHAEATTDKSQLAIRTADGRYSHAYTELCKDFYLKM